jgi:hypothetical protein
MARSRQHAPGSRQHRHLAAAGSSPPGGRREIAHTVNLRLQVHTKAGTLKCGVGLNTLAGTSTELSDPHIQFDNVHKRFSMVFIPVPAANNTIPTKHLLTSQTAGARGSWWVYTVAFSGPMFPPGTLLDYPCLGQDNAPSGRCPPGRVPAWPSGATLYRS